MMQVIRKMVLFVFAVLVLTSPAISQETNDPWTTLEGVRTSMFKAGPVAAMFSMTNVPDGSSRGESESGRVSIALPGCIRWDYQKPIRKSFLVCDGTAHYWNNEDRSGVRHRVDYDQEPAIYFFLVDIDFLKKHYSASGRPLAGGIEISLTLKGEFDSSAVLFVDSESARITDVSYKMNGSLTRWAIGKYETLGSRTLFSPPTNVRWQDEEGGF